MFVKIILFFLSAFMFAYSVQAETIFTCPTAADVKQGQLHHWLPLYIEGEELASHQAILAFEREVTDFQMARWSRNYLEYGHCFYVGTGTMTDKIVLAQDAWRPSSNAPWQWITSRVLAECRTSQPADCGFIQ